MEPADALTEGGMIVGIVAFRMPDGLAMPLSVHYPNGQSTVVACWRCADTRKVGGERCSACRPIPPVQQSE